MVLVKISGTYLSTISHTSLTWVSNQLNNQHSDKPQLFFWDELIYLSALPITKISILLFYLRIFPRRGFKYCVYALIATNVGYLISFEVISIWQCRPIDAAWKKWDGTYAAVRVLGFFFPYLECFLSCEAVLLSLLVKHSQFSSENTPSNFEILNRRVII